MSDHIKNNVTERKPGIFISYENENILGDIIDTIGDLEYQYVTTQGMNKISQEMIINNNTMVAVVERTSPNGEVTVIDHYLKMMNINIPVIMVVDSEVVVRDRAGKTNPNHFYVINRKNTLKQIPVLLEKILINGGEGKDRS